MFAAAAAETVWFPFVHREVGKVGQTLQWGTTYRTPLPVRPATRADAAVRLEVRTQ
jgi:hypothetical protein